MFEGEGEMTKEGLPIINVCSWCFPADLRKKLENVSGIAISHGMCFPCAKEFDPEGEKSVKVSAGTQGMLTKHDMPRVRKLFENTQPECLPSEIMKL